MDRVRERDTLWFRRPPPRRSRVTHMNREEKVSPTYHHRRQHRGSNPVPLGRLGPGPRLDPSDLEFFTLSTAPRLFAAPNARAWSCGSRISLCASLRLPAPPRADCYARGERRTPSGTGLRPLYKLGNAAVAALPSPQHDAAQCATVLRTCRKEEFSLERLEFLLPRGSRLGGSRGVPVLVSASARQSRA